MEPLAASVLRGHQERPPGEHATWSSLPSELVQSICKESVPQWSCTPQEDLRPTMRLVCRSWRQALSVADVRLHLTNDAEHNVMHLQRIASTFKYSFQLGTVRLLLPRLQLASSTGPHPRREGYEGHASTGHISSTSARQHGPHHCALESHIEALASALQGLRARSIALEFETGREQAGCVTLPCMMHNSAGQHTSTLSRCGDQQQLQDLYHSALSTSAHAEALHWEDLLQPLMQKVGPSLHSLALGPHLHLCQLLGMPAAGADPGVAPLLPDLKHLACHAGSLQLPPPERPAVLQGTRWSSHGNATQVSAACASSSGERSRGSSLLPASMSPAPAPPETGSPVLRSVACFTNLQSLSMSLSCSSNTLHQQQAVAEPLSASLFAGALSQLTSLACLQHFACVMVKAPSAAPAATAAAAVRGTVVPAGQPPTVAQPAVDHLLPVMTGLLKASCTSIDPVSAVASARRMWPALRSFKLEMLGVSNILLVPPEHERCQSTAATLSHPHSMLLSAPNRLQACGLLELGVAVVHQSTSRSYRWQHLPAPHTGRLMPQPLTNEASHTMPGIMQQAIGPQPPQPQQQQQTGAGVAPMSSSSSSSSSHRRSNSPSSVQLSSHYSRKSILPAVWQAIRAASAAAAVRAAPSVSHAAGMASAVPHAQQASAAWEQGMVAHASSMPHNQGVDASSETQACILQAFEVRQVVWRVGDTIDSDGGGFRSHACGPSAGGAISKATCGHQSPSNTPVAVSGCMDLEVCALSRDTLAIITAAANTRTRPESWPVFNLAQASKGAALMCVLDGLHGLRLGVLRVGRWGSESDDGTSAGDALRAAALRGASIELEAGALDLEGLRSVMSSLANNPRLASLDLWYTAQHGALPSWAAPLLPRPRAGVGGVAAGHLSRLCLNGNLSLLPLAAALLGLVRLTSLELNHLACFGGDPCLDLSFLPTALVSIKLSRMAVTCTRAATSTDDHTTAVTKYDQLHSSNSSLSFSVNETMQQCAPATATGVAPTTPFALHAHGMHYVGPNPNPDTARALMAASSASAQQPAWEGLPGASEPPAMSMPDTAPASTAHLLTPLRDSCFAGCANNGSSCWPPSSSYLHSMSGAQSLELILDCEGEGEAMDLDAIAEAAAPTAISLPASALNTACEASLFSAAAAIQAAATGPTAGATHHSSAADYDGFTAPAHACNLAAAVGHAFVARSAPCRPAAGDAPAPALSMPAQGSQWAAPGAAAIAHRAQAHALAETSRAVYAARRGISSSALEVPSSAANQLLSTFLASAAQLPEQAGGVSSAYLHQLALHRQISQPLAAMAALEGQQAAGTATARQPRSSLCASVLERRTSTSSLDTKLGAICLGGSASAGGSRSRAATASQRRKAAGNTSSSSRSSGLRRLRPLVHAQAVDGEDDDCDGYDSQGVNCAPLPVSAFSTHNGMLPLLESLELHECSFPSLLDLLECNSATTAAFAPITSTTTPGYGQQQQLVQLQRLSWPRFPLLSRLSVQHCRMRALVDGTRLAAAVPRLRSLSVTGGRESTTALQGGAAVVMAAVSSMPLLQHLHVMVTPCCIASRQQQQRQEQQQQHSLTSGGGVHGRVQQDVPMAEAQMLLAGGVGDAALAALSRLQHLKRITLLLDPMHTSVSGVLQLQALQGLLELTLHVPEELPAGSSTAGPQAVPAAGAARYATSTLAAGTTTTRHRAVVTGTISQRTSGGGQLQAQPMHGAHPASRMSRASLQAELQARLPNSCTVKCLPLLVV